MTTTVSGTDGVSRLQTGSVNQDDLAANVAGNGPCFAARKTADQSISNGISAAITYPSEDFDNGNCFDGSSKFQPSVAGYYQVNACASLGATSGKTRSALLMNKNDSTQLCTSDEYTTNTCGHVVSALVYLNGTTDYVQIFAYVLGSSPKVSTGNPAHFSAVLVRSG